MISSALRGTLILMGAIGVQHAAQAESKKDSKVRAAASVSKPDASGKQVVTVTLRIAKGWHVYGNPVGNKILEGSETVVTVQPKVKPAEISVSYPPAKSLNDKALGTFRAYEDEVRIEAMLKRAPGDTSPLKVSVRYNVCNDQKCLPEAVATFTLK